MSASRASHALKAWLEETDTSQVDLAERVTRVMSATPAVNQSTVSAWSRGKSLPGGSAMVALQTVAGILVEWWLQPAPDTASSRTLSADESGSHPSSPDLSETTSGDNVKRSAGAR